MANETSYIGQHIGNYCISDEIASGSFGRVYLAQHIFLTNRSVAIKLLHATFLNSTEECSRFLQEARFLETLKHPSILSIFDVGTYDGFPYLVTEYAPNGSLRDRLERCYPQPLPMEEALAILTQVGQALHHAHQLHIIHRDLKPENILFNARGEALLADFGIATMLATTTNQPEDNVGTPSYMAPEHFKGKISKESDQYALGCIAYEMFTGHRPFSASNFFSMGFQHLTENPVAPSLYNASIPPHIEQAILKAMSKQREERFSDIPGFIQALSTSTASVSEMPTLISSESASVQTQACDQKFVELPDSSVDVTRQGFKLPTRAAGKQMQFPLTPLPLSFKGGPTVTENAPTARLTAVGVPDMPHREIPAWTPAPMLVPVNNPISGSEPFTINPVQSDPNKGFSVETYESFPPNSRTQTGHGKRTMVGRSKRQWLALALAIGLVFMLTAGSAIYALSSQSHRTGKQLLSTPAASSSATSKAPTITTVSSTPANVLITPISKTMTMVYTIYGVTGTPDAAQHQVQARLLSSTAQAQSKTVNATGTKTIPATQASGTLVVENYASSVLDMSSGTTMPQNGNKSTIQLQLTANVAVPPWNISTRSPGTASVSARVVQAGTVGNLGAYAICSYCNNITISWDAYNPRAFGGGQNMQTATVVQQSDLDGAANPLKAQLLQSAQNSFQAAMPTNEQLVGAPQCSTPVTSSPAVGNQATTVTVTVSASCKRAAYDQQGALSMGESLLKSSASTTSYTLTSPVQTTITQATTSAQGTVVILVQASAMAVYQFSATQRQALVNLLLGKGETEAQALLLKQPGVSKATITLAQGTTLPTDPSQITITTGNTT